jgi:hypothetical protein
MLRFGLTLARPELHQRDHEDRFNENEHGRSGPDEKSEQSVDVAIEIGSSVKNRIRMGLPAGGDECQQGYRQRGLSQPARAGMKRHAKSFYRRSERYYRDTLGAKL